MHPCHNAARIYHQVGLHPIPCASRAKRPLIEWRPFQETQPSLSQIDAWWSTWPDSNVALVLGRGMFAVDLDGGVDSLRLLKDAGIYLPPDAPVSKTANGFHVFLSSDGPVPDRVALLKSSNGKAQVDIRGVGIVIAPPSIHPTGITYAWERPLALPLPSAPAELLALIQAGRQKPSMQSGGSWVMEAIRGCPEGQRDDTCTRLAGFLLHAGLDQSTTEGLLVESFARNCVPPFDVLSVRKCVQSVARREARNGNADHPITPAHIADVLKAWEKSVDDGPPSAVASPYPTLNKYLGGGIRPGELMYIGARAGVGKTALALEIARHAGLAGIGTMIVSREMVNTSLIQRIIAQASRIPATTIRTGSLSQPEWHIYGTTRTALAALPIWMTDEAVSIEQIADLLSGWSAKPDPGLLIVDYLQLVRAPREIKERRLQVEHISQELKGLAVQYQLPVICMSSLSRAESNNRDRKPQLSDLRESGELEHDADIILLMHRGFDQKETEIAIAKNRSGRVGLIRLEFTSDYLTFDMAQDGD